MRVASPPSFQGPDLGANSVGGAHGTRPYRAVRDNQFPVGITLSNGGGTEFRLGGNHTLLPATRKEWRGRRDANPPNSEQREYESRAGTLASRHPSHAPRLVRTSGNAGEAIGPEQGREDGARKKMAVAKMGRIGASEHQPKPAIKATLRCGNPAREQRFGQSHKLSAGNGNGPAVR